MKKKALQIAVVAAVLAFSMAFVDGFLKPPYFLKSAIKVLLFSAGPAVYFCFNKSDFSEFKKLFKPNKNGILLGLGLGTVCYIGIAGGYLLLKDVIDFSNITKSLTADIGVSADNFLWVSLYISLCNSALEELFFRGFAFAGLKHHTKGATACLFSSVAFSLYHIGMTLGWVEIWVFMAGLLGLVAGGAIFNLLTDKFKSIYPSWLTHMFINFGINTVGFMLFGMI